MTDHTSSAVFATRLIYQNHGAEPPGTPQEGTCCFCGTDGPGQPTQEAIDWKYFSDSPVMRADTGHVCEACTYCIGQRELKNGHWIATASDYHSVSTGDLRQAFARIREELSAAVERGDLDTDGERYWLPEKVWSDVIRPQSSIGVAQSE